MKRLFEDINMQTKNVKEYSPVTLAYIGDSVYELFIRQYLLKDGNLTSYKLHKRAVSYVSANAQCGFLEKIKDELTEKEMEYVKRARNQKSSTVPKNTSVQTYRMATAFEALIGYLYLSYQYERLNELLSKIIEYGETNG